MPRETLQRDAFERFLAMLDPFDRERAGTRYEELRVALIRFFRWRACNTPEDLADEALSRACERSLEGDAIRDVAAFLHGIARLLVLEDHRRRVRQEQVEREAAVVHFPEPNDQRSLDFLDSCLDELPAPDRELILRYYTGRRAEKIESRRRLSASMSVSLVTLRVRAHRLRERLVRCLSRRLSGAMK